MKYSGLSILQTRTLLPRKGESPRLLSDTPASPLHLSTGSRTRTGKSPSSRDEAEPGRPEDSAPGTELLLIDQQQRTQIAQEPKIVLFKKGRVISGHNYVVEISRSLLYILTVDISYSSPQVYYVIAYSLLGDQTLQHTLDLRKRNFQFKCA